MIKTRSWKLLVVLSMVLGNSLTVAQDEQVRLDEKVESETDKNDESALLMVGSKAPALDIEHWIQDGEGKYKPVTKFENGKVYIVEFWATWCGPCIKSMPHLAEIQKKYHEKGVRVVSVSDEELDRIEEFLELNVRGEADQTYNDITKVYSLTTDPDGSTGRDYMEAAQLNGIPNAFIVGKSGVIEWIGHPMAMDGPLEQIVADKWDRKAYLVELKMQKEFEAKVDEVFALARQSKMEKALDMLDALLMTVPEKRKRQLKQLKFGLLMQDDQVTKGVKLYLEIAEEAKDDAEQLNMMAWSVVAARETEPELIVGATKVAKMGLAVEPKSGSLLDTLAHLQYLAGDLDLAIATQKKAVSHAGDDSEMRESIEDFLEKLLEEKEDSTKEPDN